MLTEYAAIAEIISSLGVIISLIYVARQLKQTTGMMQVTASSERVDRDYTIVEPLLANKDLAEVWNKGDSNFDELDAADQTRVLFFERRALVLWHHLYNLRKRGLISEMDWEVQAWVIRNIGRRQAVRRAWDMFKGGFNQEFLDFVEGEFAAADEEAGSGKADDAD